MSLNSDDYRVHTGDRIDLKNWPTGIDPLYDNKKHCKHLLDAQIKELSEQQHLLYAANQYSLLVIFQAMDAAGKDSAIRHVMTGINPQGCQVYSFKHPSPAELEHDFLWRAIQCLPERGRIGIFNRSYYEEVLIARVHPEILHSQGLPTELLDEENIWQHRYQSITHLEDHLHRNGTRIVKLFLHLSKEEQRLRFLARIDKPEKNWKLSQADLVERQYWKQYRHAYEQCLKATSTDCAPWYIVPADDKRNTRLIIAQILVDTLKALKMHFPLADGERQKELDALRQQLILS